MQMPSISRARAIVYAAAVLAFLVVGGRLLSDPRPATPPKQAPRAAAIEAESAPARKVLVHVVGAVEVPGLYELDDGSRVDDAIRSAGGAKPKAALELVNLAAPVADGQQVVVPRRTRAGAAATGGGSAGAGGPAAASGAAPGGRVHLNSATLEELDTLPGVGPVTAQKILDYRNANGAFSSVDELDAVPGIGPARLEELKAVVDL